MEWNASAGVMSSPTPYEIKSFANAYLGQYRIVNNEINPEYCPFCRGGDNDDRYTFFLNRITGMYNCHRGKCNASGNFQQLQYRLNANVTHADVIMPKYSSHEIPEPIKEYAKLDPEKDLCPRTEECTTYLCSRGLSEETLDAFNISSDRYGNIAFPFYEDGELVLIKYRKPKEYNKKDDESKNQGKEWSSKDGKPILFGMDKVSFNQPLVITEGQVDAMSLYEAGITNVVSVPMGCNNLEWIKLCWDWLDKFSMFILFGDNDAPGRDMINTVVKRLGEDRCMLPPKYPIINKEEGPTQLKDANEILYYCGPEVLKDIFNQCEPAPVEGVLNLSDVRLVNPQSIPRIATRIPTLDKAIAGFAEGGLTVISGKRGEGKSTISGIFLLNAIDDEKSVAAYSGELSSSNFLNWIMCQACDRELMSYYKDDRIGKKYSQVPYDVQQRIRTWMDDKFYLYDNSCVKEGESLIDSVLKRFALCARRYGCKLFLVDNLMMLTSGIEEELKMQAKITAALKQFAVRYKVHVILVAHPRKTPAGQAFSSDDVAGSAAITNLADIVMSIEKPNIRVTKNREFGETPFIKCCFDPATRRIGELMPGDQPFFGKPYRWDHTGVQVPQISVLNDEDFQISYGQEDQPF